jgi:N-acetyl sugar amidotransferase
MRAANDTTTQTSEYQICLRCIMDTSDPDISFDPDGICNHCSAAFERFKEQLLPPRQRQAALDNLVTKIRDEGRGREYDCIIGVSGGVDSTTVALNVSRLGLRALAVHFDNGWDSELAVDNIARTLTELSTDLFTYVVDWEEFRDLQLAFIRASVANAEAPTDHGILALLFKTAREHGTRFILSGSNLVTEAIMPTAWGHYNQDLRQLKALHRRFGTVRLKTMPTIGLHEYLYYVLGLRIRQIPFLNFIEYDKEEWKRELSARIGWRDYGGKHYESVWTRYFQGFYLPAKFGYDKRRAHLSTLICSGQVSREEALGRMKEPPYTDPSLLRQDAMYVLKKFGLTQDEFDSLIAAPPKNATDYPNNMFLFKGLERYKDYFRAIATTP